MPWVQTWQGEGVLLISSPERHAAQVKVSDMRHGHSGTWMIATINSDAASFGSILQNYFLPRRILSILTTGMPRVRVCIHKQPLYLLHHLTCLSPSSTYHHVINSSPFFCLSKQADVTLLSLLRRSLGLPQFICIAEQQVEMLTWAASSERWKGWSG